MNDNPIKQEGNGDEETTIAWRQLVQAAPEFVQWVVQTQGPPKSEVLTEKEYNRLANLYRRANGGE